MRRTPAARSIGVEIAQTPCDQVRLAQFARQFQRHVAAQRKADQK